jgi:pimeloyl-ACP methyl ester carboxylesterase
MVNHAAMIAASRAPFAVALLGLLAACAETQGVRIDFGDARGAIEIPGLSRCWGTDDGALHLDPDKPLVVIVHGCNASQGRFRSLAAVFEAHDQQTVCFNYDDRRRMEEVAEEFAGAVRGLEPHLRNREITVLGHSQGGLVARRALIDSHYGRSGAGERLAVRLVTVSSPFRGIEASAHCSMTALHVVTLGVSAGLCAAIAGAKWREIHPRSEFMTQPGDLTDEVGEYVKVVTDERDTCRRVDGRGRCAEDDFVFSVPEQYNEAVDGDGRVRNVEVKAGHVEIVGGESVPPRKLVEILQANGVLARTPPDQVAAIDALLEALF